MAHLLTNNPAFRGESRSMRRVFPSAAPVPRAPIRGIEADFDRVLFWARLAVAQSRKSPERFAREAEALLAWRDHEGFLTEFLRWRESEVFTPREKIAIEWGEAVARGLDRKEVDQIWKRARDQFAASEIIQLNLSVQAINDWFDNHAQLETYVLIVQPTGPEGPVSREPLSGGPECTPVYATSTEEAMNLLTGTRRPGLASKLTAIVIDVHLPRISAREIMERVKHRPGLENLPVVVTTSSSQPEDLDECERLKLKLEADGVTALNVVSVSDAFSHIARHHAEGHGLPAENGRAVERLGLLQVYERLRVHFDAKR